jgi:hypothetical protein
MHVPCPSGLNLPCPPLETLSVLGVLTPLGIYPRVRQVENVFIRGQYAQIRPVEPIIMISSRSLFALPFLFNLVHGAVVLSAPAQTFNGVGGSGAWWPHDLHKFPESVRQNVSNLLFSEQGLGLSSYRYNLGGGGESNINS